MTDIRNARRRVVLGLVAAGAALPGVSLAQPGPSIQSKDPSFARVKSSGLTFGTTNDQPFDFVDTRTHQTSGVDAEMLHAMLQKLGLTRTQMKQVDNEELIGSLLSHRMDMIADALYITEKRKQVIAFSDGWYKYGEVLLVKKGNPLRLHSLQDVNRGARVGAGLGTVYLDWAKALSGAKVSGYPDAANLLLDLKIGRIDAAILDAPVAQYDMHMNPQYAAAFEVASNYTPKEIGVIGAAFRKEDAALREAFNWALAAIKRDGTDLRILQKWGLSAANRVPV